MSLRARKADTHAHLLPLKAAEPFSKRLPKLRIPRQFVEGLPESFDPAGYFSRAKREGGDEEGDDGVDVVVNLPVAKATATAVQVRQINEWCVRIQEESRQTARNRVISFGAINPHGSEREIKEELRFIKRSRLVGVKLHPIAFGPFQNFDPSDLRQYGHLYRGIVDEDLIVCWHMGAVRLPLRLWKDRKHSATPEKIAMIQREFHLRTIAAHLGNDLWENVKRYLADFEEVAFDLSYTYPFPGIKTPYIYSTSPVGIRRVIADVGINRLLPGSDFPYMSVKVAREGFDRLSLSPEQANAIQWDNPVRIFGFNDLD